MKRLAATCIILLLFVGCAATVQGSSNNSQSTQSRADAGENLTDAGVHIEDAGYEVQPTAQNTGATGALTDVSVSSLASGMVYENCHVVGGDWAPFDNQVRQAWNWTFRNCTFDGNIQLRWSGPDGTLGVYSGELPTLVLDRVTAQTLLVLSPINLKVNHSKFITGLYTHSGNLNVYTDWRHQFFPMTISNSFFFGPYAQQPVHTEAWFGAGFPDGVALTNVTLMQGTGSLMNSGVTATTNIHFGPGTLGKNSLHRVYFEWGNSSFVGGAPAPAYNTIQASRGQLEIKDCFIAARGASYFTKGVPDEDVSAFTFANCRDIDSSHLLNWQPNGTMTDSGNP